jgi:tetratricopeptide (TPR) repeat protein
MHALRRLALLLIITAGALRAASAPDVAQLLTDARAAETKLDSRRALELYLAADQAKPDDAAILQKIARQYSDLVTELTTDEDRRRYAQTALDYSLRAVALAPQNPETVLSLAVSHGKLAVYSDTKTKIQYSRLVKEEAERALGIDPNYAWAHHVLGRWHYEVATLGFATRFFVRIIYGGLPAASTTEAVRHLQRAVDLEPNELAHQLELGFALAADGQKEKARTQWDKGLALPSREKHDDLAKTRARTALSSL